MKLDRLDPGAVVDAEMFNRLVAVVEVLGDFIESLIEADLTMDPAYNPAVVDVAVTGERL